MKLTTKQLKRIIKEELNAMRLSEANMDLEPRITNGTVKIPGLNPGAQGVSILVNRGQPSWGKRQDGKLQIYVLPKPIGMYATMKDALNNSRTGESYYMSPEEIEAGTMSDSARPRPQSGGSGAYTSRE